MQVYYHQRSKLNVTRGQTQFSRFRTVTPVWIHIWWWNDAQSLMWHRRGALLFFKVIHQISRSYVTKKSPLLTQIGHFLTVTPFWIHWWLWNEAQNLKQHGRGVLLFFKVICQISRSIVFQGDLSNFKVTRDKKLSILTRIGRFWTVTPVWFHWWLWNDAQSLK